MVSHESGLGEVVATPLTWTARMVADAAAAAEATEYVAPTTPTEIDERNHTVRVASGSNELEAPNSDA